MSRIDIEVHNTSQHYILFPVQTQLGRLQWAVTPMELILAEPDSDRVAKPECTEKLHTAAVIENRRAVAGVK